MSNWLKTWVIPLMLAGMPLKADANGFGSNRNGFQTKIELSNALNYQGGKEIVGSYISPKIITEAIFDYFDKEVKLYKLSQEVKEKIRPILNSYLSAHPLLVIWEGWRMSFVIDDMGEFCRVVKLLVNIILDDMTYIQRKVFVTLASGSEKSFKKELDDLPKTVKDMGKDLYKNMVFGCFWWIVKTVAILVNWKMTIEQYYSDVSRYFPNKNFKNDSKDNGNSKNEKDITSWKWNVDIKYMKYPFKK